MESNIKYRARHDYVIVRSESVSSSRGGVALPDVAAEARRWKVIGKGPLVDKTVVINDYVMIGGTAEQGPNSALLYQIPGFADTFIVKDKNVIAIMEG